MEIGIIPDSNIIAASNKRTEKKKKKKKSKKCLSGLSLQLGKLSTVTETLGFKLLFWKAEKSTDFLFKAVKVQATMV